MVSLQDYKADEDPATFKSVKTGRGPLGPDWKVKSCTQGVWGVMNSAEDVLHVPTAVFSPAILKDGKHLLKGNFNTGF